MTLLISTARGLSVIVPMSGLCVFVTFGAAMVANRIFDYLKSKKPSVYRMV